MTATISKHEISSSSCLRFCFDESLDSPERRTLFYTIALLNLDTYCPNWTTNSSYLLPPTFQFRIPRDQSIVNGIKQNGFDHSKPISLEHERAMRNDEAEFGVFEAIQQLIESPGDFHPFIAFQHFNVHRTKGDLIGTNPLLQTPEIRAQYERCFREYDFMLIGPKIGMVFLEVMSAPGEKRQRFNQYASKHLIASKTYAELLKVLSIQSGRVLSMPDSIPRRVVFFAPNLVRESYVENNVDGVIRWFKDDMVKGVLHPSGMVNGHSNSKPSIYQKLREFLSDSTMHCSQDVYESFVPIMTVTNSLTVLTKDETGRTDTKQINVDMSRVFGKGTTASTDMSEQPSTSTKSKSESPPPTSSTSSSSNMSSAELAKSPVMVPLLHSAQQHLDKYFTGWNKNGRWAKSYTIPQIFAFMHPQKPDDDILNREPRGKGPVDFNMDDRIYIDRISDHAEFIVFEALQRLIPEMADYHPFLAIRGLSTNRMRTQMERVFPGAYPGSSEAKAMFETQVQEYDFVIIGPRIGLIVIEVKGTHFTQKKHFTPEYRFLPEVFLHGLDQLRMSEKLLDFLKIVAQQTDSTYEPSRIRKILFTPNLRRSRFDEWLGTLKEEDQEKTRDKIGDVTVWFQEDMENGTQLSGTLHRLLCDRALDDSSTFDLYEPFARIMTVMSTITVAPSSTSRSPQFTLDDLKFSQFDPKGNPVKMLEAYEQEMKKKSNSLTSNSSVGKTTNLLARSILLTPDQLEVLNGPPKQFIIGAAGAGKTIILQAKALELLRMKEDVVICCAENYKYHFDRFLKEHGFRNPIDYRVETVRNFYQHLGDVIRQTRHILVDDALDIDCSPRFPHPLKQIFARLQTVWIAFDPYEREWDNRSWNPTSLANGHDSKLNKHRIDSGEQLTNVFAALTLPSDSFEIAQLRQVMRCPETVYRAVYDPIDWGAGKRPLLGHKVQGAPVIKVANDSKSIFQFMEQMCGRIADELDRLIKSGFKCDQIAIITNIGSSESRWHLLRGMLMDIARRVGIEEPNTLSIVDWDHVSSMEWPAVIFISITPRNFDERLKSYAHYRACSRCTGKLIEIDATYADGKN